jgi:hypothetical protein
VSTQITQATRLIVAQRSWGRCEVCGQARATEMSHRRPKGMGGTSVAERHGPAWLIHACNHCHQQVIEKDREHAREMGWLLLPAETPEMKPALLHTLHGHGWWYLLANGDIQAVISST